MNISATTFSKSTLAQHLFDFLRRLRGQAGNGGQHFIPLQGRSFDHGVQFADLIFVIGLHQRHLPLLRLQLFDESLLQRNLIGNLRQVVLNPLRFFRRTALFFLLVFILFSPISRGGSLPSWSFLGNAPKNLSAYTTQASWR